MEQQERTGAIWKSVIISVLITIGIVTYALSVFEDRVVERLTDDEGNITIENSDARLPMDGGSGQPIADVVEATIPAVVSVVISADVPVIERYYEQFNPFGGLFGDNFGFNVPRRRQVGTQEREIGGGTGFFVSEDGYIVTNRHVVDVEGARFSVLTNDGTTYDVEVVAKDPSLDIAILKVTEPDTSFPHLQFGDSEGLRLGETTIAIGNALAEFPNSVSVGVVSGLARNIVASDLMGQAERLEGVIQTDAAINRGNSGGPLLNSSGEVIGVSVAVAGGSENIGFAIPSSIVAGVYESVAEHGEIVRPFLGVRYMQITEDIAERNDLPVDYGVLIVRGETSADLAVIPGSPADKAGLAENDIILEVDGTRLDSATSLAGLIRGYDIGETVTLTVLDDGEERSVDVILEQAPTQ